MSQFLRQQYGLVVRLFVLLTLSFVSACGAQTYEPPPPLATPGLPEAWLDWPVEGQYPPGPLEILAHVHDPSGQGITGVELSINGESVTTIPVEGTPYFAQTSQRWPLDGPPQPGEYLVEVQAINKAGQSGEPASAWITIAEKRPQILSFTADKTDLKLDECVILSWTIANAQEMQLLHGETVLLEEALSGAEQVEDNFEHCPRQPTNVYRLIANPQTGEPVEQPLTIVVEATPTPPPEADISFEYDDSGYITFGDPITLFWMVKNAQEVKLNGANVAFQGSQIVYPTEPSNVYLLSVTSLGGEPLERMLIFRVPATPTPTPTSTPMPITATPTPTLTPAPLQPAQITLNANPTTINRGGCTTLSVHIENVKAAFLSGGNLGRVGVTGPDDTKSDCPSSDTTYVLSVDLISGGTDSRSVPVQVVVEYTPPGSGPVTAPFSNPPPSPDTIGPPAPIIIGPKDDTGILCSVTPEWQETLEWQQPSDPSGISHYRVRLWNRSDSSEESWEPVTGTQRSVTVKCGIHYEWAVRARDGVGNYGESSERALFHTSPVQ